MARRDKSLSSIIILVFFALFFIGSIRAACNLPYGSQNIAVVGRNQPLTGSPAGTQWDWSSVQVSVVVSQATAVSIKLSDNSNVYNVIVDGSITTTLTADNRNTPYSIATGLDSGTPHTITLFKRTEASFGVAKFYGFVLEGPSADQSGNCIIDGATPPSTTQGKIEFLGDSITCGYGNLGTYPCSFSAATEDSALAYGNLVAEALNAELHQESWSGIGVVRNYGDSNPTSANPFPPKFGYSLGTQSNTVWSYSEWVPDVVVINLGTNDYSTNPTPPQSTFEDGYKALIATIRSAYSSNPNLEIFLACGPLIGDPCCTYVQNVVTASGANIHYIDLQGLITNPNTEAGCDYHPNVLTQRRMANLTLAAIQPFWQTGPSSTGGATTSTNGNNNDQSSDASPIVATFAHLLRTIVENLFLQ